MGGGVAQVGEGQVQERGGGGEGGEEGEQGAVGVRDPRGWILVTDQTARRGHTGKLPQGQVAGVCCSRCPGQDIGFGMPHRNDGNKSTCLFCLIPLSFFLMKICFLFNGGGGGGGGRRENSNSKTLFSMDCSLGSFRPV